MTGYHNLQCTFTNVGEPQWMFAIVIQASLGWKSILAAYHFSNFSFLEVIFQKILGTYYSSCIQEVQTHNCIKHNILCNIWKNSALPIRSRIVHAVFAVTKHSTVKSFSEALILASVNPQYDERLFFDIQNQGGTFYDPMPQCPLHCATLMGRVKTFTEN